MEATVMTDCSPSPQFSSLPPELRSQIWRDVLPDKVEPALFFYKKGCWQPRFISETDEDYDPVHFFGIHMYYRHEFLDRVEVDLPLFFVNREARGIVQAWMRGQNIELSFHQNRLRPAFVRQFVPLWDALYVPHDRYDEFCCEPLERGFEPDLIGQSHSYGGREIPNIAIPEELFWTIYTSFDQVGYDWFWPVVLLIVVDVHPDLCSHDSRSRRQWNFDSTRGRALIWDYGHRRFDWGEGEYVCEQDVYNRIEDVANKNIVGKLVNDMVRDFKIRPVLAVRR